MTRPATPAISPFFIVADAARSIAFYRDRLGFEATHQEPQADPFFAILRRDGAQLFVKAIDADTPPQPNPSRHPWARWDAYVHAPDPDRLAEPLPARGPPSVRPCGTPRTDCEDSR